MALTAAPEGLQFALNGATPADLFSLLPAAYTGAVEQIRAELDALVGLAPVKEYVFGLADNLQVQQRRAAAGFKTTSLSMHMIFTGNPGTGKTTIARLVAKYLKAIGALKGGLLALWRIMRCNPFSRGGYDPVPEEFRFGPRRHASGMDKDGADRIQSEEEKEEYKEHE